MELGLREALNVFRSAAKRVPAYRDFLKSHGFRARTVRSYADFARVPIMDKQHYLYRYATAHLFPDGKIPPFAYASSGSSGKPTFWFRSDVEERRGGDIHEIIFRDMWKVPKSEPTLVVVCFAMGLWVAGSYTAASFREVARRGFRITTVTPGIEREDILNVLRMLAPQFRHVVLTGYPPFVMDVIVHAKKADIPLPGSLYVLTAGDKFTEAWRDDLMKFSGIRNPAHIVSIYGSADAGVLGYETPLSIFVRQRAAEDSRVRNTFFGEGNDLPAFVQYNPRLIYFEEQKGELLFTAAIALPLVRYSIHDEGKLLSFEDVQEMLERSGLRSEAKRRGLLKWKLPFIIKRGRTDVAVTFYALNIYPENIKAALAQSSIKQFVSGQYFVFNRSVDHNRRQKLCINIELAPGVKSHKRLGERMQLAIADVLGRVSIEYRKLRSSIGDRALPSVRLVPAGGAGIRVLGVRGLLNVGGKKSRIVDPAIS